MIYDVIGCAYSQMRRTDPRIDEAIRAALGDAQTVLNVGAGAGSYEPPNTVLAVEPSQVMIRQRRAAAAPVVRAVAEALPVRDKSVDAALAVLTVHHWTDVAAGIGQMRRVARRRLVFFTCRPELFTQFWLLREYLPEAAATDAQMAVPVHELTAAAPEAESHIVPVPVPHDCIDGFAAAYWRRPHAYLDPHIRAGISMLAKTDPDALAPGLARLKEDIHTGRWHQTHAELLECEALDVGYCTVTIDL